MWCSHVLVIAVLVGITRAFPTGASDGECTTLSPIHGVNPRSSSSPYTINIDKITYGSDTTTITVTISSTSGASFKGFMIKAVHNSDKITGKGTFIIGTATDKKLLCGNTAVTHTNSNSKTSIQLTWRAPSSNEGALIFRATVVQSKSTFWESVYSAQINPDSTLSTVSTSSTKTTTTVSNSPTTSTTTAPRATLPTAGSIDLTGCGNSKGCFTFPQNCKGVDCTSALAWSRPNANSSYVQFEMVGKQDGWIAFAFDKDTKMGDDDVIMCLHNQGNLDVQHMYTTGKAPPVVLNDPRLGLSDVKISYIDGILSCSFRREIKITSASTGRRKRQALSDLERVFDINSPYYLFLAYGSTLSTGAGISPSIHTSPPMITSEKLLVIDVVSASAAGSLLFQIHGLLMLSAWVTMISISLILARHYKTAWPNRKIDGKQPWFPLHTGINVIALFANCAGIVIVFVAVDGMSPVNDTVPGYAAAHPVIGLVVTGLMIINPIMAAFRCAPDHKNRGFFNVAHYFVGTSAHILAILNIFFGMYLSKSSSFTPDWVRAIMYAFIGVHIFVSIVLEIYRIYERGLNRGIKKYSVSGGASNTYENGSYDIQMENLGQNNKPDNPPNQPMGLTFKYVVLTCYILVNIAFAVAMIVGIMTTSM